jgi:hypothetical protein
VDQRNIEAFADAAYEAAQHEDPGQGRALVESVMVGFMAALQAAAADRADGEAPAAPYAIPGPYDIAMAFGPAALASGRFENIGAAMAAAWFAIPEFYQARDQYLTQIAPAFYGVAGQLAADAEADDTGGAS